MPILFVHGYSAEGNSASPQAIRSIYKKLPALLQNRLQVEVQELNLSRYISLDDSITLDDVSNAMQRALERNFPTFLTGRFDIVTHSTGAIVVRNWLLKHWDPETPCPARNIVHLAGAHFGSPWAHIGRSQIAKWARLILFGTGRGQQILERLELGSNATIELHRRLNLKKRAHAARAPVEFCIVGSQYADSFAPIPVKYANEEGSDGVVRVAASSPNFVYGRFVPNEQALRALQTSDLFSLEALRSPTSVRSLRKPRPELDNLYRFDSDAEARFDDVPLAVVSDTSHSSILDPEPTPAASGGDVLGLIGAAIGLGDSALVGEIQAVSNLFEDATRTARMAIAQRRKRRVALVAEVDPREQFNRYAQVVIRVFDQDSNPVKHFNAYFNPFPGEAPSRFINDLFADGHPNEVSSNTITFYIKVFDWDESAKDWVHAVAQVKGCTLEIDALAHDSEHIRYLPFRKAFSQGTLANWLVPDRTTVIDVHVQRVASDQVFRIVPFAP